MARTFTSVRTMLFCSLVAFGGCHKSDEKHPTTTAESTKPPPADTTGSGSNAGATIGSTGSPTPGDLNKVGRVEFKSSCKAQAQFERALALLHSFFYEEARNQFTAITQAEPDCAIAHWGIAMTWYHELWAPPNDEEMQKGRAAIDAATKAATKSDYEKGFIDALAVFYASEPDGKAPAAPAANGMGCHGPTIGHSERAVAYTKAMEKVYTANPNDTEIAAFYALSLLGSAKPGDPELVNQHKAAEILEKLWAKRHDHPGVVHYLIHAYDSPQLAKQGLEAAKAYADIAPWVPHALHMPSHIFTRLGMWADSIASNKASREAAQNYLKMKKLDGMSFEELHAIDYLVYAYLQIGQDQKAKEIVDYVLATKKTVPEIDFTASYAVGAVPARYAIERHAWKDAAALTLPEGPFWTKFPFTEAHIEYARGLGRARSGDLEGAKKSLARLGELRDATNDPKYAYFKQHVDLQNQAVAAWIAHAEGKNDVAVKSMKAAAEAEEKLGKHPVSPGPINVIYEQLGDLLLELNKPADALAAYEQALKSSPGRLDSVLGAGQAAEKAGKADVARTYYQQAVTLTEGGTSDRADLASARAYLAKK